MRDLLVDTDVLLDLFIEREPHKDFEDSIQYFCALENDIHDIVTRNARDFLKREILILTPREFMAMDLSERKWKT